MAASSTAHEGGETVTPQQKVRRIEWQRNYRRMNDNIHTRRYERTKSGFLMRLYRNMQSRVTGVQYKKAHLYVGLSLLPRGAFYEWARHSDEFHSLWDAWVASGHTRRLVPTIDRIDSEQGYLLPNMRWVTHSENSRAGSVSRHHGHCRSVILRMQA